MKSRKPETTPARHACKWLDFMNAELRAAQDGRSPPVHSVFCENEQYGPRKACRAPFSLKLQRVESTMFRSRWPRRRFGTLAKSRNTGAKLVYTMVQKAPVEAFLSAFLFGDPTKTGLKTRVQLRVVFFFLQGRLQIRTAVLPNKKQPIKPWEINSWH